MEWQPTITASPQEPSHRLRTDHPMSHETINILLVDDQPSRLLSYEVMLNDLRANLIEVAQMVLTVGEVFESGSTR